jgi:hypothetical protein
MMTVSKLQLAALTISLGLVAPAQAVLIRSTVSPDNVSLQYKATSSSHLRPAHLLAEQLPLSA